MTGVWSTIKGAPAPIRERQGEDQPRVARASGSSSSSRPSSPPKVLGTSSSRPLPRSYNPGVDARGARSPGATSSQSFSPGKSSPSRLSRSSTALGQGEKSRAKDRKSAGNANEDSRNTTTVPGTGNGTGSSADVTRATPQSVQPSASSTIDPLSQHIFMRKITSTDQSIPHRLTQMAEGLSRPSQDLAARNVAAVGDKR
ncbi:hypothetical protein MMYC01_209017 [Madurella mycetomatis]|uniref:Uncharacterized protein n=1 Tax=Madurella mycetomatis TaxID=100816 RepID=A0A175VR70_9PEZI|nr:hypothetical protein MMYC01_209017 [Madurella mycetomatis]